MSDLAILAYPLGVLLLGFLVLLLLRITGVERAEKARQRAARQKAILRQREAAEQARANHRARYEHDLDPRVPSSYGEMLEREEREARSGRQGTGRR